MLGQIALQGASFAWGMVGLVGLLGTAAYKDKLFFRGFTSAQEQELAGAQERYWDLATEPMPGFKHAFVTLKNGVRLHYVVNTRAGKARNKNVAVFVHGMWSGGGGVDDEPRMLIVVQGSPTRTSCGAIFCPRKHLSRSFSSPSTFQAMVVVMASLSTALMRCWRP
jgi:hypothetical protein